jgi:DNA adenine methylase
MPRSFIQYVGGKTALAEDIYTTFPPHTQYVEVFGGAAGVLLQKPRSEVEVYNDVNDDLVTLFRVARDRMGELREWLQNTPYARSEYDRITRRFYNGDRPDDEVAWAGWVYYIASTNFAGKMARKAGFCRDRPDTSGRHSRRHCNSLERLDEIQERLQGVSIECLDWRDVFRRYDAEGVLFYCDPPYLGSEQYYAASEFDHAGFGRVLRGLDGEWAVSYGHVPGWATEYRIYEFDHHHAIDGGGRMVVRCWWRRGMGSVVCIVGWRRRRWRRMRRGRPTNDVGELGDGGRVITM